MELTETQSKRIVASVRRVFDEVDANVLSQSAYYLITQHMGHIAHFNLYGFRSVYADLRLLARSLQTSEYSTDPDRNEKWANELDRRYRDDPIRGCGQPPAVTATIRGLVAIARAAEPRITELMLRREVAGELGRLEALAAKHGYTLTRKGEG